MKVIIFLHINNKLAEKEVRKKHPIHNSFKKIKYLEKNMNNEAKSLYSKNFKILKKETKGDSGR